MRRTSPLTLGGVGLAAAVVGFLIQFLLVATGNASIVPPYTFAVTLVVIAIVVVALAWPVRRAVRGNGRVDPFRAARTAMLAKACSVGGALFGGLSVGLLVHLLTRPVIATEYVWPTLTALVAGGLLLAGGLVAENFCTLPPPEDPKDPAVPTTPAA